MSPWESLVSPTLHVENEGDAPLWEKSVAGAMITGVLVLHAGILNSSWRPSWDSAIYLSLAKSLAEGSGYRYMGYPHAFYPPGLPLILATVLATVGTSYAVMRLLMLLFGASSAILAFFLLRRRTGRNRAFLVATMYAVSLPLLDTETYIQSDVPFACCAFAVLVLCERSSGAPRGWRLASTILLLAAAVLIRTVGVTLAGALLLYAIINAFRTRVWRDAVIWVLIGSIALGVAGVWHEYAVHLTKSETIPTGLPDSRYPTYFAQLKLDQPTRSDSSEAGPWSYERRLVSNIRYYTRALTSDLIGSEWAAAALGSANYIVLLLPLVGFVRQCRRRVGPAEVFVVLYMMVLLIWPWRYQRFLLPVLPLVLLFGLHGLDGVLAMARAAWRKIPVMHVGRNSLGAARPPTAVPMALFGIATLLNVSADLKVVELEQARPYPGEQGMRAIVAASDWLSRNTRPGDVVVCFQAAIVHWLSGRTTLVPPWTDPPDVQLSMVMDTGARWVLINTVTEESGGYLKRLVAERSDVFSFVTDVEGVQIWSVSNPLARTQVEPTPGAPDPR